MKQLNAAVSGFCCFFALKFLSAHSLCFLKKFSSESTHFKVFLCFSFFVGESGPFLATKIHHFQPSCNWETQSSLAVQFQIFRWQCVISQAWEGSTCGPLGWERQLQRKESGITETTVDYFFSVLCWCQKDPEVPRRKSHLGIWGSTMVCYYHLYHLSLKIAYCLVHMQFRKKKLSHFKWELFINILQMRSN